MNEPFQWNDPGGTPDLLSQDLRQRTALVAVSVLAGLGAGLFCLLFAGVQGGLVWLGFSVLAMAILFLLTRYFELGIVGFLAVCWIAVGTPTIAQAGSGGGAQQLKVSQAGLIVLLGRWAIRRLLQLKRGGTNGLYHAPVNLPILLYLGISIWSTVNAVLFPNQLVIDNGPKQFIQVNMIEVLLRVLSLGGLLMIGNSLQGKSLKAGAYMAIIPGVFTFLLEISGLHGIIPESEYLAFPQMVAMGVLASVVLTGTWTKTWVRVVCAILTVLMLYHWFVTGAQWVSGWLGAFIALAIIVWSSNRKLFWVGAWMISLIVLLNFRYFYKNVYTDNFYAGRTEHDIARQGQTGTFTNDRTRMWAAAARYASSFPLGIGLGNYRSYNNYFGRVDVWNTTVFTSAHGTYSQALSETGWPGFISFLLLIFTCGRMLSRYQRALAPGAAKTYMLGAWGGCVGVFCSAFNGDYLFPTYHNGGMASFGACVYTWCVIGVCVGIARQKGLVWSEIISTPEPIQPRPVVAPVYNRGPYALGSSLAAEDVVVG